MEKLLHERLRDGAAKTDLTFIIEIGDEKVDFRSKHALAIADEIERYYIPRPRFEDGEPISVDYKRISYYYVFDDGSWCVRFIKEDGSEYDEINGNADEPVKLPTHKEPDSIERILDDATIDPRIYYNDHIGHDVGLHDDAFIIEKFAQHLIKRAALIERGA